MFFESEFAYDFASIFHCYKFSHVLNSGNDFVHGMQNLTPPLQKVTLGSDSSLYPKIQVTPQNASVTDSSRMSFASQMFSAATFKSCTIQIMAKNVSIRHDQRMESCSADLNIVEQNK